MPILLIDVVDGIVPDLLNTACDAGSVVPMVVELILQTITL